MNLELELRYRPSIQRPATAWLVPGTGPQTWLAELAAWQTPLAGARLYPVPEAVDSARIAGVVVVLLAGGPEPTTITAIAYGRLAEQLLAPVEAAVEPPLAESELAALFPAKEATWIWHPTAGLLRFAPGSELRVADLLAAPTQGEIRWDAAEPGLALNDRLVSIEPLVPLTLGDVLAAGRGDIGSQPLQGSQLPAGANEPAGGAIGAMLASAGMSIAALGAGAVAAAGQALSAAGEALSSALASVLPAGGSGAGNGSRSAPQPARQKPQGKSWFERLAEWAKARRQAAQQNIENLRNRQVERLLGLLNSSPDDGLKFALPMGGPGEHRGLAPPSAQLGERQVDFNLGRLGGGQPVDPWCLPPELQARLMQKYRDLAHREIALGRHRRAAYIFAELLGDLSAAAATLADGGHFREAAVLYKQRLNQAIEAADCLARGGLWAEAIALYEELGLLEIVGDLYRQLDREEEARAAYRRVVDERLGAGDYLSAAKLVEEKLTEPEEAYQILLGGWTAAPQQTLLDAAFELLARRGTHDKAGDLVATLRESEMPGTRAVMAIPALALAANRYPSDEVRRDATDATRFHIANLLPTAPLAESARLVRTLATLVPADRLLDRDCHRYQSQQEEKARQGRRPVGSTTRLAARKVELVHQFRLPSGTWRAAVSSPDCLFAAGIQHGELSIVRARWSGKWQQTASGWCSLAAEHQGLPIRLACRWHRGDRLAVHLAPGIPARPTELAANDHFEALSIAPPPTTAGVVGLQYGLGDALLVASVTMPGLATISAHAIQSGALVAAPAITHARISPGGDPPSVFCARGPHYYLGVGPTLLSKHELQEATMLHGQITAITGSHPQALPRIVVACDQGGVVLWGESARSPESSFSMDLVNPVVGLSRGGVLAAATSEAIEVFRTDDGRLTFLGELAGPQSTPIAVLPTPAPDRFGVVTEQGEVLVYEASRG